MMVVTVALLEVAVEVEVEVPLAYMVLAVSELQVQVGVEEQEMREIQRRLLMEHSGTLHTVLVVEVTVHRLEAVRQEHTALVEEEQEFLAAEGQGHKV
jgi:hypothetical protein